MTFFPCILLTWIVSQPQPVGSMTLAERAHLPCVSLLYLVDHPEVARRMNLSGDKKANLVLAREVAREAIGPRPESMSSRKAWIGAYIREESEGRVADVIAEVLSEEERKKLRELRKECFKALSPEIAAELKLNEKQRDAFMEVIARADQDILATKLRAEAHFEKCVVGAVAQREFAAAQELSEVLDAKQQWSLAHMLGLPVKNARDVKSPFRSDYRSVVKLLLVGKLRGYLAFSSGTSQAIDTEIAAWRDEQEKAYVEAERDWTPFKQGHLYPRLLKCDMALKGRLEEVLPKEERHRLAQITLQLQGVCYAFTSEGARAIGVSDEQMKFYNESFMARIGANADDFTADFIARLNHPKPWERDGAWLQLTEPQKEKWLRLIGEPLPTEVRRACNRPFTALGMKW